MFPVCCVTYVPGPSGLWAVGCGLWAVGCGLWAEISVVSASRHAPSDEAKRASDATLCPCGGPHGLFDPASLFPDRPGTDQFACFLPHHRQPAILGERLP